MKKMYLNKKLVVAIVALLSFSACFAHSINDPEWKFKLEVPSTWSKNVYMDGADKVYDFYSADQNAGASLRILQVNQQINLEMLIPLYEQNMLQNATRVDLQDITSKNGISGKQAIYSMDHNGNKIDIAVFYTIQNSKAYILSALVANVVAENYRADIQSITASFKIDGVGNQAQTEVQPQKNSLSGLGGLAGGSSNTSSKENYVTISGGKINGTFYFSKSASYPIKWNETVTIRGLNDSGINALELYILNHKGTGKFTYGTGLGGPAKFHIGAVDGKGFSNGGYSGSGELVITEYREGGRIKGHFTAQVDGHTIKGSFNLSLSTPKDYSGADI